MRYPVNLLMKSMLKFTTRLFSVATFFMMSASLSGCGLFSDADEKFLFGDTRKPDALEYEYRALANELHSTKPCYLIHPQSLSRGGFGPVGNQVSLLRSRCFAAVAESSGDERLCDKVRSASTLFSSGANLNAESCRRTARLNHDRRIKSVVSYRLDVPQIVSLSGYDEEEIDAYLVSEGRFSSLEVAMRYRRDQSSTYWNEVKMTLLHTEEFFDRIVHMPGFGTSDDQRKMNALGWNPRQQRLWTPPDERTHSAPEIRLPAQSEG
ncbi:hypothetical protein ACFODV_13905 [Halomonas tibetensis]|uniref:Lipoprotein n=1 Tax=Halomonas tibetensis TaxID=2259590 RepID=A0ABV7B753_9GAMM